MFLKEDVLDDCSQGGCGLIDQKQSVGRWLTISEGLSDEISSGVGWNCAVKVHNDQSPKWDLDCKLQVVADNGLTMEG